MRDTLTLAKFIMDKIKTSKFIGWSLLEKVAINNDEETGSTDQLLNFAQAGLNRSNIGIGGHDGE